MPPAPASAPEVGLHRYPVAFECEVVLGDGTVVAVRPVRPDDAGALSDFHEHLSSDTIYKRYFCAHPHLRGAELERFTHVDYHRRFALVAERGGRLYGVARYDRDTAASSAEVAFVLADDIQGHGLGPLLLEHLAAAARHRGISTLVAETLLANAAMQQVFRQAGFASHAYFSDGVVRVTLPVAVTQSYLDAVLTRLASSARAWLAPQAAPGRRIWAVCPSVPSARRAEAAGRGGPAAVSALVVPGDPSLGLAALGMAGEGAAAVVVDLDGLRLPRRLMAVARALAGRVPVLAADPDGSWAALCEQAGMRSRPTIGEAVALAAEPAPAGGPSPDGALIDMGGCQPARARQLLDGAGRPTGPPAGVARVDTSTVTAVLGAYGITGAPGRTLAAGGRSDRLAVSWDDGTGRAVSRFVPLTDHDVADLGDVDAEIALRLGRLVDDQPDVWRVEVSPAAGARMWIGPPRSNDDDPFVRRLPSRG
ncbi:MAG TPA: GNAT family N-acetyltransferase [Acidimicrobiales bacterium]|nr:GNAT family N-acetyltransferase [Acidimicrobiales bacterium]